MGTTHKSGSVSLSLPLVPSEFHCKIQIRSTDSCENWCFSLSQQIRLIFVSDTGLHQSPCQKWLVWIPAHPRYPTVGPQCRNAMIRTICIETLVLYQSDGGFSRQSHPRYILIPNFWKYYQSFLVSSGSPLFSWFNDRDDEEFSALMFGCLAQLRGCRMLNAAKLECVPLYNAASTHWLNCTMDVSHSKVHAV